MSKFVKMTEEMKIGIYDPYLDTLGGGEKYMVSAAACLSKKHEVSVFWDDEAILTKLHERFLIDISSLHVEPNIFSPSVSTLERVKKSRQYDRIFFLSDGSIPFLFCKKLYLHFQFPVVWLHPSLLTKIKLARASGIICNSYFTKQYIDKKFGIKSLVIYPPSTGEYNDLKNFQKEKIILSVGRFNLLSDGSTFKKQEVMISLFGDLVKKYRLQDWELLLVISAREEEIPLIQKLKDKINDFSVKICINASAEKLQEYYAKASIYWHAAGFGENIKNHPEMAEHFGIATVQAMERGAVPVVIHAGGQGEIVQDGENGFLWKTKEECIKKTAKVIVDKKLWNQLSRSAQKRAADFSVQSFCEKINSLFKSLSLKKI